MSQSCKHTCFDCFVVVSSLYLVSCISITSFLELPSVANDYVMLIVRVILRSLRRLVMTLFFILRLLVLYFSFFV